MAEKKWCVYMHTNKINGKRYVGITCQQIIRRWGINGNNYKGQIFYKAIVKYGWENFDHEILFENILEEEAKEKEIYYIKKYKTYIGFKDNLGYNATLGGDGSAGYIASPEAKKKIRDYMLGKKPWNKGKHYKIPKNSVIQKNLWKSEKYRQNMVDKNTGKKLSEETKQKISKNNPRRKCVYQLDRDTLDIINKFDCVADAIAFLSGYKFLYSQSNILSVMNGESSQAYGYKWIENKDYENKTDLYYKIIDLKTPLRSVLKLSSESLNILKKYSYTNELRLDYSEVDIKKIKQNSRQLSKSKVDGCLWCFFDEYEKFKKKINKK